MNGIVFISQKTQRKNVLVFNTCTNIDILANNYFYNWYVKLRYNLGHQTFLVSHPCRSKPVCCFFPCRIQMYKCFEESELFMPYMYHKSNLYDIYIIYIHWYNYSLGPGLMFKTSSCVLKMFYFCVPQKNNIQVWNNVKVRKIIIKIYLNYSCTDLELFLRNQNISMCSRKDGWLFILQNVA